jgi:hypothetical protein
MLVRLPDGAVIYASEAQIEYVAKQIRGEAMSEGLVAPTWSDSGEVPVGEVTYTTHTGTTWTPVEEVSTTIQWTDAWTVLHCPEVTVKFAKPSDPSAKPSMPALSRIAGEAYRGLGWCDE